MINNIEKILERSPKYIKEFMCGCTIEEKLDTHYITIEIISRNEIKIKKANGNEIDRVDLILNSMWNNVFLDWNYLKLSNPSWFAAHVGFTIKVFYFPCKTPILTEYDPNIRYVFDRVMFNNTDLNAEEILSDIKFPSAYQVGYKHMQEKVENPESIFDENFKDNTNPKEMFEKLINSSSKTYAVNKPEGYIFKYKNKIYQTATSESRNIDSEKTSYEYLLTNFVRYCKTSDYTDKISQSYTQTVCNLFNDFIINFEKQTHTIEHNINVDSIENPYLGTKFEIGYQYIPDQVTKALCQESVLYKNIFKVLLANLRKGKDYSHCIFMSSKQVDEWNTIIKNIRIRTLYC